MRNVLLIIGALVLTVLVSIAFFVYPSVRDAGLQGAGFVAKNVCSGHFVSGLPVEQVMAEAIRPIDEGLAGMNVNVDDTAETVDVNVRGLFNRRAVRVPGAGCTLLAPGVDIPQWTIAPLAAPAATAQPWPMGDGPINRTMVGVDYNALNGAIDHAFVDVNPNLPRNSMAIAVIWRGTLLAERYDDGIDQHTPLLSWSMAKSVTNAQLGILYGQEAINLFGVADVPEWQGEGDPRGEITIDEMLRMSSGLAFNETYAVGTDVTRMLSQEVSAAAFAANMPLAYEPGEHWSYSSGTSNILSRLIRQTAGGTTQDHYEFAQEELFWPLHAYSFQLEADPSGSSIGSSYMYATARDWARLGQLFLQDGVWEGQQLLPRGWVDYSRTPTSNNPRRSYGAHFWLNAAPADGSDPIWPAAPRDAYYMSGFQGQYVVIIPSQDMVIVRLGFATDPNDGGMDDLIAGVVAAVNTGAE